MRRIFRLSLIRRFISTLRDEGSKAALGKARHYVESRLRGDRPSMLGGQSGRTLRKDHTYLTGIWQTLAQNEAFHVSQSPGDISAQRKIALIGDLNLPQCRKYRVQQLAEFWAAQGVAIDYAHYEDIPRCVALMQDATHLMEYRLQATPVTAMYRYEARRLRLPVLYDLDDPLFSVAAYETYKNMQAVEPWLKAHFVSEAPKYLEMMNGADLITVSTPGMAEHTRLLTRRPVHVRRNFADRATLEQGTAASATVNTSGDGLFRVCFASGSRGHEVDFAMIADQVAAFLAADRQRRLMILGHFDPRHLPTGVQNQIETYEFSGYNSYLQVLAQADLMLTPLTDDLFNRCKSAVRVIDAAAVNVPSLVGMVGDMRHVVIPGKTGLIADTLPDWGAALERCARDPSATAAMGQAARAHLEHHWSGAPDPHIIDSEILDWVTR